MICYFVDSVLLLGFWFWCLPGNVGLAGISRCGVFAFVHSSSWSLFGNGFSCIPKSCEFFPAVQFFLELHDASALLLTLLVFLQLWQFKSKVWLQASRCRESVMGPFLFSLYFCFSNPCSIGECGGVNVVRSSKALCQAIYCRNHSFAMFCNHGSPMKQASQPEASISYITMCLFHWASTLYNTNLSNIEGRLL